MIKQISLLSLIFLTLVSPAFTTEDVSIIQKDEVSILFEERLRVAAEETAHMYPRLKAQLEKVLNWDMNFKPTIVLTSNQARFEQLVGNSLVVAYAVPQRNLIVIDYLRTSNHPFSLGSILKHELCHLLLHHHIKRAHLPKWLDEGVSQWVSDGIAEIIMSRKGSILNAAVLSNRLIGLERLSVSFPRDEKPLLLAYEESKSVVEYMGKEFGRDAILSLLQHMKDGYEVDMAVQKSLSMPFNELEKKWRSHLRKRITWFTYLASNLYGILFFLAALITVFGFIRLVIKKRQYVDEETSA